MKTIHEQKVPLTMLSDVTGHSYGYIRQRQGNVKAAERILQKHIYVAIARAKREYNSKFKPQS